MAWDDDKSTAADPDNPAADEQLTADEWDAHVADQKGHASRHESGGSDEVTELSALTHTPGETIRSLFGSIGQGYPTVFVGDDIPTMKAVDPANFSDDTAALQALADFVDQSSGSEGAELYLPASRPDGGRWTFPGPVEFGQPSQGGGQGIWLTGVGFCGYQPITVPSTNNFSGDDAIFQWSGAGRTVRVKNLKFQNVPDANLFFFQDADHWVQNIKTFNHQNWFAIVDSSTFEWTYQNIIADGNGNGGGIKLQNVAGSSRPGKGHIQAGCSFLNIGQPGLDLIDSDEVWFNGNIEGGSNSSANINAKSNCRRLHVGSQVFLFDGDPCIQFDGNHLFVAPTAVITGLGGSTRDGIVMTDPNSFKIGTIETRGGLNGTAIDVQANPNNPSLLPNQNLIQDSVNYPSGGSTGVYEMDVTQL